MPKASNATDGAVGLEHDRNASGRGTEYVKPGSLVLRGLAAVVLHFSDHGLPAVPIPPLRMTALRSRPIAMPYLALVSRTRVKSGEAPLAQA